MREHIKTLEFCKRMIRYWAFQKYKNKNIDQALFRRSCAKLKTYRYVYKETCEAIHNALPYR